MPARPVRLIVPLVLAALLGCRASADHGRAPASTDPGTLGAADLAAIRGVDSSFASAGEAGSAEAMAALYAADAQVLPPNAPAVEGRAAIQKLWGGLLAAYQLKLQVVADEVEGRGDLAYARGHYTMDATPRVPGGAAPFQDRGKFLEILRRQADGSWRYAVDMYSSDLPAPK